MGRNRTPQYHEIHTRATIVWVSGTASARKAKIFSLNAAKLFEVDVDAKRKDLPKDYLSHIKMAYLEESLSPVSKPTVGDQIIQSLI